MEKHSYIAELKADIEFSDSDFELLLESSRRHYDSTVQSICCVGGFLYGLKNRRDFSKGENKSTELRFGDLQLLIKSLEFVNTDKSNHLYARLTAIFMDMQAKNIEINEDLKVF